MVTSHLWRKDNPLGALRICGRCGLRARFNPLRGVSGVEEYLEGGQWRIYATEPRCQIAGPQVEGETPSGGVVRDVCPF